MKGARAISDSGRSGPRKGRARQREERRQQIVDAALHSIATRGFADTTLATVARNTDMSQASLVFHFKTKDALLTATLEHLVAQHRTYWQTAIEGLEDDPLARICAMVAADFSPTICTRKRVAAWHAFYGEAKVRPTYSKICGDVDDEHTAVIEDACRDLIAGGGTTVDDPRTMATMIDGLTDGMWSWLLFDEAFDRAAALDTVRSLLRILFPNDAARIDRLLPGKNG